MFAVVVIVAVLKRVKFFCLQLDLDKKEKVFFNICTI